MKKPTVRGPAMPTWHRQAESRLVAEALRNDLPRSSRERFLTPTSAKREAELLGEIKRDEVKP